MEKKVVAVVDAQLRGAGDNPSSCEENIAGGERRVVVELSGCRSGEAWKVPAGVWPEKLAEVVLQSRERGVGRRSLGLSLRSPWGISGIIWRYRMFGATTCMSTILLRSSWMRLFCPRVMGIDVILLLHETDWCSQPHQSLGRDLPKRPGLVLYEAHIVL